MKLSCKGREHEVGGYPTVGGRIVSPASVQESQVAVPTAPDDHFGAGPHCRVPLSAIRRVADGGGVPTIGAGVISAAGVQINVVAQAVKKMPTPDDHFGAGPHCRVPLSAIRRVADGGGVPTIGAGVISAAGVQINVVAQAVKKMPTPDDHFGAGPHCRVPLSAIRRVAD